MCSQSDLKKVLDAIVLVYKNNYADNVVSVILYGSYARGDNTSESDIDVVAIVKGNRADLQAKLDDIWDKAAEISLEYDVVLSPTVIPQDEFEENKDVIPYYRNIDTEGIRIVA